ncbi:MAG: Cyclohexanone monooxygenase, partial [uncultured Pseudonocardia sp.]
GGHTEGSTDRRGTRRARRRGRSGRSRHGGLAARGRPAGLRRPGEGRRRGRHLAGEHLPRLRVRRRERHVLLLVRAQTGLEPDVRRAGGDPRLHPHGGGRPRDRAAHPVPVRGRLLRVRRRGRPVGGPHRRRHRVPAAGGRARARCAAPAPRAAPAGARAVPRDGVPHRAVGPLGGPGRQAGGGRRHRVERGAGDPRDRRRRRAPGRVPADRALGAAEGGPAAERLRAQAVPAPAAGAVALPAGRLLDPRAARARVPEPQAGEGVRVRREADAPQGGGRPRVAGRAHPGLRDRLQADPALQRLPARVAEAERRAGDRADHRLHPGRGALGRRPRARGGRRGARDRLLHRQPLRRGAPRGPGRAHHPGGVAGRHDGLPGDDRVRVPEPVHDHGPELRRRRPVDPVRDRGTAALHRAVPAPDDRPRRHPDGGPRGRAAPVQHLAARQARPLGVEHRRLPQLVPRPDRAQPPVLARHRHRVLAGHPHAGPGGVHAERSLRPPPPGLAEESSRGRHGL